MKPPRHKRDVNTHDSPTTFRQASSEDELDSIFASGKNKTQLPMIADEMTSQPDVIDQSVTLEPYGRRRPAWLDDSMDSTHSDTNDRVVFQDHYFPNESETDLGLTNSTNFSNGHHVANPPLELNYDPMTRSISRDDLDEKSAGSRPRYDFTEEIERGFEDALSIDYITHSNNYPSMGLCFESIMEESEVGSDSASSLSHNDSSSTVFKTQAVVSGSANNSLVDIREEIAQEEDSYEHPVRPDDSISNSYPRMIFASRTTADGDEGRDSTQTWQVEDPWKQQTRSSGSDASDKALPSNGFTNSPSPWADIDYTPQSLKLDDMSFGSDFSQQSDDEILNGNKGRDSSGSKLEPLSSYSFESAYF